MRTYRVSELEGVLLDAAVARAEGLKFQIKDVSFLGRFIGDTDVFLCFVDGETAPFRPSTAWADAGPIIERKRIRLDPSDKPHKRPPWAATIDEPDDATGLGYGPTALVAAMRAYVNSEFGDEVKL